MSDAVQVRPCELGRGLFATRPFALGDLILRFSGALLTHEEVLAKGASSFNPLQIAPRLYVDVEPPGVYLNHSCEPNAAIRDSIFLIALRAIEGDEEIRFDYSTTMDEKCETMNCLCGVPSCRRIIGDFINLPEHLKRQYLSKGVVQPFIWASGNVSANS